MNKSIKSIIAAAALMLCATAAFAQKVDKRDPEVTFNHHWFLQVQGGIGYTEGDTIQPFAENARNRVCIVLAE